MYKLALIGCCGINPVAPENSLETEVVVKYRSMKEEIEKSIKFHDVSLSNGNLLYINRDEIGVYPGKSYYYPSEVDYKSIFVALKQKGISNIISVSPVCSLEDSWGIGSMVLIKDFIDFVNRDIVLDDMGTDYADMTTPFSSGLNLKIKKHFPGIINDGIYLMGINATRFETTAEMLLFKRVSKQNTVSGMVAPTEAQLAKLLGMQYSTIAVVVNTSHDKKRVRHEDSVEMVKSLLPEMLKSINNILPEL